MTTIAESSQPEINHSPRQATVIVPCYNEEAALPHLFERFDELERRAGDDVGFRFLLVDDCSRDSTWNILQSRCQSRHNYQAAQHEHNRGITAAIMTGIRSAPDEIVCSIDADSTYDPLYLLGMLTLLTPEIDMVTASPYHPQGEVDGVPGWRLFLSKSASRIYRWVLVGNSLHTSTSCCRIYRRSKILNIPHPSSGFAGVTEMLLNIDANGGQIAEYPARLTVRKFWRIEDANDARHAAAHETVLGHALPQVMGPAEPQCVSLQWSPKLRST